MNEDSYKRKKSTQREENKNATLTDFYHDQLHLVPNLLHFLRDGYLDSNILSASDFSYSVSNYAGNRYRLFGDAAGAFPSFQW
jgi:flavine halogenase